MKVKADVMIFGELDHPNNCEIFSKDDIEKMVEKYNNSSTQKLGELGTNNYFKPFVSMSNVSHKINNIYIKDNKVVADIDILDTTNGKIAKNLLESSTNLYASPVIVKRPDHSMDLVYINLDINPNELTNTPLTIEKE